MQEAQFTAIQYDPGEQAFSDTLELSLVQDNRSFVVQSIFLGMATSKWKLLLLSNRLLLFVDY